MAEIQRQYSDGAARANRFVPDSPAIPPANPKELATTQQCSPNASLMVKPKQWFAR
jgi:hypothetical protein